MTGYNESPNRRALCEDRHRFTSGTGRGRTSVFSPVDWTGSCVVGVLWVIVTVSAGQGTYSLRKSGKS